MTKIMLRPDEAAVATQVLDVNSRRAVDLKPIPPLDDDRPQLRELFEAEVAQLGGAFDAVQVDMRQLDPVRAGAEGADS